MTACATSAPAPELIFTLNHYYMDTVNKIKEDCVKIRNGQQRRDAGYPEEWTAVLSDVVKAHGQEMSVSPLAGRRGNMASWGTSALGLGSCRRGAVPAPGAGNAYIRLTYPSLVPFSTSLTLLGEVWLGQC